MCGRDAGAGRCGGRVGFARELPPQRDVGRPPALCVVPLGLAAAIRRLPVAAALRTSEGRKMCGRAGRHRRGRAGLVLGAFWRRPRPSLLGILFSTDIARCVARRRFLGPGRRFGSGFSAAVVRVLQRVLDGACPCRCVARERRPGGTRPFSDCSPSSAGSFLTAVARAARGSGRTPMVLSCRASPKYPR